MKTIFEDLLDIFNQLSPIEIRLVASREREAFDRSNASGKPESSGEHVESDRSNEQRKELIKKNFYKFINGLDDELFVNICNEIDDKYGLKATSDMIDTGSYDDVIKGIARFNKVHDIVKGQYITELEDEISSIKVRIKGLQVQLVELTNKLAKIKK